VLRDYYKQRMNGMLGDVGETGLEAEPDFSMFTS
jgi:hypothetical protein